jgi:hypothetical protein
MGLCRKRARAHICPILADGMTANDWIAISGIVAVIVTALGLGVSYLSQQRQKRREDVPHIELGINCQVFGQDDNNYLVEFTLMVNNRGLVKWTFRSIQLRVRGIREDEQFAYWPENGRRLKFPVKILDKEEVIPKSVESFFVEPGVQQAITYVTKISTQIMYIVVYVEFWYDKKKLHTSERVFRLTARAGRGS